MNIGFFGILGLIFIVLKLADVIDWSWWLVLAPIYGPLVLSALFVVWAMKKVDWDWK